MGAGYANFIFEFTRKYPLAQVPALGGKRSPFVDSEERARLRNQFAEAAPSNRASTLILHADLIAGRVCMNAGGDAFAQGEDEETIFEILRKYFRPDAPGHRYRRVAKFSQKKRAGQTMERYLLGFDVLRRKVEARVILEEAFPDS